jgi:hypothetical protein
MYHTPFGNHFDVVVHYRTNFYACLSFETNNFPVDYVGSSVDEAGSSSETILIVVDTVQYCHDEMDVDYELLLVGPKFRMENIPHALSF